VVAELQRGDREGRLAQLFVGGLARHGVDEVVLSLGDKEDVFRAAYPDATCAGVRLRYAVEPEPLDTAGAVRFAAMSAGIDETFIVVNGDVFTDLDVGEVWRRHHEVGAEGTIALTPVDDPSRYGVVPTDSDGRVLGFVEKPPRNEAPTNWINAGTYVFEPSVLNRIDDGRKVSIERETFPSIVADGSLWAVQSDAYWVDAGTPATYLQIQLDLIDGLRGRAVNGVSDPATVSADAVVDHSVVMAGAVIEPGAIVRDSAVLSGAVVGAGSLIEGSIVGPGASIGARAKITELSMIGYDARVEPNAIVTSSKIPEAV